MFALSGVVMIATGGLTYALAMLHVVREAAKRARVGMGGGPIVVLGVQLPENGVPGFEFRERLDHGAILLARGEGAEIVVLGGVTRAGQPSEAEAGKDHLVRYRNVPAGRIECESRSHHTLENLYFYRQGPLYPGTPVTLVTSRFHMARACLLARGLGLAVDGSPSDRGIHGLIRVLVRLPWEGLLIHWYVVGRAFARITRNERMARRIS